MTAFRSWCYDRAIEKHGWWSKLFTALNVVHVVLLMTQATTNPPWVDAARSASCYPTCSAARHLHSVDPIFLALTLFYLGDIFVRVTGLGWRSYSQNGWNLCVCERATVARPH